MARSKVAGPYHMPKGDGAQFYVPQWQMNAVLGLSVSTMGICQYPALQSSVDNTCASLKE